MHGDVSGLWGVVLLFRGAQAALMVGALVAAAKAFSALRRGGLDWRRIGSAACWLAVPWIPLLILERLSLSVLGDPGIALGGQVSLATGGGIAVAVVARSFRLRSKGGTE